MSDEQTPADSSAGFSLAPGLGRVGQVRTLDMGLAQEQVREALFGVRTAEHRVDRFTLLEPVGRGGMGMVYAAYDPQLDRRVALKLVRTAGDAATDRDHVLAEARAMAKVSHPNVVTVFEVGLHAGDDGVFVAMEFVQGQTLRKWVRATEPDWRRVLDVYRAAAAGLMAVHDAGLLHRDFKPDNVMIDRDGRVRVMDFGLAHELAHSPGAQPTPAEVGESIEEHTRTGSIRGTPAYMAPEQLEGATLDHRADQFSFCVALYEALWGERPWRASSVSALAVAVLEADGPPMPPPSPVPAAIRRAVLRGLAREPDQRWPSLPALMRALGESPRGRWRRLGLGLGLVAAVGGAAVWVQSASAVCADAAVDLDAVWNDDARSRVHATLVGFGRSDASQTADRTTAALDDYVQRWRTMRRSSCEATHVRRVQSEAMLDLRTMCLESGRAQLSSLVDILSAAAQPTVLEQATLAAQALPSVEACGDLSALSAVVAPPTDPADRARLQQLRTRYAEAAARLDTGGLDEGVRLAEDLVRQAEALGYAPMLAQARLLHARLLRHTGESLQAETVLHAAAEAAAQGADDRLLVAVWSELALVVAGDLGRSREAVGLVVPIEAAVQRVDAPAALRAVALLAVGNTLKRAGDLERGAQALADVVELRERELPHDALGLATALSDLGSLRLAQGQRGAAVALIERSLSLRREALGDFHPLVAQARSNLGNALSRNGRAQEASAQFLEALTIYEATIGRDNRLAGLTINNLGLALQRLDRLDEAEARYREALSVFEGTGPSPNADVGMVHHNLAVVFDMRDQTERSIEHANKARAVWVELDGPDHQRVAMADANIGSSLVGVGRYEEAAAHWERALEVFERVLGRDHPTFVMLHIPLSDAYLRLGKIEQGVAAAKFAYVARTANPETLPAELADARFAMAMALWASNEDRERAVALAQQSRDALVDGSANDRVQADNVGRWLEEHPLVGEP